MGYIKCHFNHPSRKSISFTQWTYCYEQFTISWSAESVLPSLETFFPHESFADILVKILTSVLISNLVVSLVASFLVSESKLRKYGFLKNILKNSFDQGNDHTLKSSRLGIFRKRGEFPGLFPLRIISLYNLCFLFYFIVELLFLKKK